MTPTIVVKGEQMKHQTAKPVATVTALYHYPVKSCAGTARDRMEIDVRGPRHDREFMIVDASTGEGLTQRRFPRMARIQPTVRDGLLHFTAPGIAPIATPIATTGEACTVTVWGDVCRAIDHGPAIAAWCSDVLQSPTRLVRMAADHERPVDPAHARSDHDHVRFPDGYPWLLISRESLADLNARLAEPLPMNRFRPNIVVSTDGEPFREDQWRRIRIGAVDYDVVKACVRCALTTVDQATASRGKEPLATLATYRRGKQGVLFGQHLIHAQTGVITVGQRVDLLA